MTRLLNTPIIGPSAKTVAFSWIDMLAGLSGEYILRIPPDFCATAGSAVSNPAIATHARSLRFILILPDTVPDRRIPFDGTFSNTRSLALLSCARFSRAFVQRVDEC
jgi:hypothetical protein